jgi:hypothetical protein
VNLLRARRLLEKVVELGMISLPSPFKVRATATATAAAAGGTCVA